ncbi:nucleoside-diphosphate sugar epimerase/dehydratase [Sinanaerobacter sp. ZZT-01]|uniref:polysaccharide biosynthesis protein n=1 Tax=Sinanaerobacter sp. ZZT-01 TaxID=3111540 RepID=UPI002D78F98B|nr:nucleoside-diphosphate sugar epimerase/dehydratase [Sinanaerobacter sp. ZZT-01]WRR94895.1 nucleoside-diphosphate sugar epimerase/dehydratase [Sinanaerobacter sp. ZZT-01]
MIKYSRIIFLLIADVICMNLAYILAFLFRFDFNVTSDVFEGFFAVYVNNIVILSIIKIAVLWLFGLYNSLWKYAGVEELANVAIASIVAGAAVIVYLEFTQQFFPRSIYITSCNMDILFFGGSRLLYRTLRNWRSPGKFNDYFNKNKTTIIEELTGKTGLTKVMLIGAGDAGASIIKEIKHHPEYNKKVVIAVDDNPEKLKRRISGVKIAGNRSDIKRLARKYGIDEIIIAIPSGAKKEIQELVAECNKTRCKMKIVPSLIDLINDKVSVSKLRDVDIEDLLGRDTVQVNLREISQYIEGKIVLVTGAGGSIGSELCRQIAAFKPRRLVALDIYENTIFELSNEIKKTNPHLEFDIVICSVRDKDRLEEMFEKYKPHVVFHAAAHKHVPLMELNLKEAIVNNILGTQNMVDLSDKYAVGKFVLISTDKAVNPTNVMGATKRVAEMILQHKSTKSNTCYSAVRFGNVLGSNGSVIPIFRKQIAQGGPVTVTHPKITRYFMTIPEAVQLVIQAGAMAEGGEIFILDMGNPVKIMELAENVIRLSGYVPYVDIDIKITGLRPGEKLFEELLLDEEGIKKTNHNKIYVGHPVPPPEELKLLLEQEGNGIIEGIQEILTQKEADARLWLKKLVPNYNLANVKRTYMGLKEKKDE